MWQPKCNNQAWPNNKNGSSPVPLLSDISQTAFKGAMEGVIPLSHITMVVSRHQKWPMGLEEQPPSLYSPSGRLWLAAGPKIHQPIAREKRRRSHRVWEAESFNTFYQSHIRLCNSAQAFQSHVFMMTPQTESFNICLLSPCSASFSNFWTSSAFNRKQQCKSCIWNVYF